MRKLSKRERRKLKRLGKALFTRFVYLLSILFILWFGLSFIEVNVHNMDDHHDYWDSNMFVLMTKSIAEEQL